MTTSAAVLKKCDPVAFYDPFLLDGALPDGRDVKSYRPVNIRPGTNWKQHRSVIVEHGDVLISITGKLILERDNDSPVLKVRFRCEDRKKNDTLSSVADTLKYLAKRNTFFDPKQFITEEEVFRWHLKVYVTVFNADGFIMDAVLIGLNALFLQIELPKVSYNWLKTLEKNEQTIDVHRIQISKESSRKLIICETPVYSAFILYQSKNSPNAFKQPLLIVDPPTDLIDLSSAVLEFIHISNGRILLSDIKGALPISHELFEDAAQRSAQHYLNVVESLKKYGVEVCRRE